MANETLTMSVNTAQSVSEARHELDAQLDGWSCGRAPDALLVFSELVTNAIKHAGGAIRVVVLHGDHSLRFEVYDDTHSIPAVREVASAPGGFGLRIVEQISESWGWDQTATGKVVWSNLDCCASNSD